MSLQTRLASLITAIGTDVKSLTATVGDKLTKGSNLADLTNTTAARTNLGLGSAAELDSTEFMYASVGGNEKVAVPAATTGTVTLNLLSGSIFTLSPTGNFTIAITNAPGGGTRSASVRLCVTQGATPRTITHPSGTTFYGAASPTQQANKKYIFDYFTTDGGTSWHASAAESV